MIDKACTFPLVMDLWSYVWFLGLSDFGLESTTPLSEAWIGSWAMRSCQPSLPCSLLSFSPAFPLLVKSDCLGSSFRMAEPLSYTGLPLPPHVLPGSLVSEQPREACIWGLRERIAMFSLNFWKTELQSLLRWPNQQKGSLNSWW